MNDSSMAPFRPGEIISINWKLGVEHDGIYTSTGTVIAGSKRTGSVVEEDLESFSGGRKIRSKGYPSTLCAAEVELNARERIGKRYNLFGYNCQHFATECHGQRRSRQLRSSVLGLAGIVLTVALTRGRIWRA